MRVKTRGSFFNYGSIAAYFLHALIFLLSIGGIFACGRFLLSMGERLPGGGCKKLIEPMQALKLRF